MKHTQVLEDSPDLQVVCEQCDSKENVEGSFLSLRIEVSVRSGDSVRGAELQMCQVLWKSALRSPLRIETPNLIALFFPGSTLILPAATIYMQTI